MHTKRAAWNHCQLVSWPILRPEWSLHFKQVQIFFNSSKHACMLHCVHMEDVGKSVC